CHKGLSLETICVSTLFSLQNSIRRILANLLGDVCPFSHLLTVEKLILSSCANCSCVMFSFLRISNTKLPNSMYIHLFRFNYSICYSFFKIQQLLDSPFKFNTNLNSIVNFLS